jgi:hypothetical protein
MTDRDNREEREQLIEALWIAVSSCDPARVQSLLDDGCDPDTWGRKNRDGDLPLQAAARIGGDDGLAIIKALVKAGADIDHPGDYRSTAMHRAVYEDKKDGWATARFLVQSGADCTLRDRDSLTPPEAANNNGNDGAVLAMLDEGMSPRVSGVAGSLLWYVSWDSPDLVEELLKRGCPADFWGENETPLGRALESFINSNKSSRNTARVIRILLDAGADSSGIDETLLAVAEKLVIEEPAVKPGETKKNWKDRQV